MVVVMTTIDPLEGKSPVRQTNPRRRHSVKLMVGAIAAIALGGFAVVAVLDYSTQARTDSFVGVESIVVDLDAGGITLQGSNGAEVVVNTTLHSSVIGSPDLDQRLTNGVLTITGSCSGLRMNCGVDQVIAVPPGVPVAVRLNAGDITANGLDVPQFQSQTGSGRVTASFVRPPDLVDIRIDTGELLANLPDTGYRVDARTSTGRTDIELHEQPDAQQLIRVRIGTGNIKLASN